MELETRQDAFDLLQALGAPEHLQLHVALVGEAADSILEKLDRNWGQMKVFTIKLK